MDKRHLDETRIILQKHPDDPWEGRFVACLLNHIDALDADIAALKARLADAERERDLAIAHDRQPYPTVDAYEKVCDALSQARAEVECLQVKLEEVTALMNHYCDLCLHTNNGVCCCPVNTERSALQPAAGIRAADASPCSIDAGAIGTRDKGGVRG